LSSVHVIELGRTAVAEALKRANIDGNAVDEVYLGNVLQANVGQAPAQQVSIAAGINTKTPCTTINKVCASGMKAIMLGAQSIQLGDNDVVVVGGMESMSNAPHYLPSGRTGIRYGNGEILDAIVRDGLQDPYKKYMMGNAGEVCAKHYSFSREDQDNYAISSYKEHKKRMQTDILKMKSYLL
jgi:acetyl-CoA C-acetyltransferase